MKKREHAWGTKGLINSLRKKSYEGTCEEFSSLLEYSPNARLLDIGCSDGLRTTQFARKIGTQDIVGIDVRGSRASFKVISKNVEEGLPFVEDSFDVVTACHIIEHLSNTDLFAQEIYRVLRPNGYAVIETPNMANGLTIIELLLNKQPGIAHISDFLPYRDDPSRGWEWCKGYLHRRLFTMEGLENLLTYYGFRVECKKRTGYGRFIFGRILRGLYAANLLVKVRK